MSKPISSFVSNGLFAVILLGVPYAGFLLAEAATHGLEPAFWPAGTLAPLTLPARSFGEVWNFVFTTATQMASASHPAFIGGGTFELTMIITATLSALAVWFVIAPSGYQRERNIDPDGQFGMARWATKGEMAKLDRGLELGLDPESGKSVRVRVESNILSIAPPRSGKTSAFIIPNLLALEDGFFIRTFGRSSAWQGPAVIIDPKGDVFDAVARRRRELGRPVYCLDFRRQPKGADRWNPLASIDIDDVLYLQRTGFAVLPSSAGENHYFRQRGAMFLAGVIAVAVREAQMEDRTASPGDVQRLLSDREALRDLAAAHDGIPILLSLLSDLNLDQKSLDPLVSTAQQGVQSLLDRRIQRMVETSTFDLVDVARGKADLFLVVPTEDTDALAPLVRWLISDLFEAVRNSRRSGDDRVLLMVDEAANLGKFEQMLLALGELPGRGLSLWTFWQTRSQLEDAYGAAGARTIFGTAAISTFSNVGGLGDEDVAWFSRTLGTTTEFVGSQTNQTQGNQMTISVGKAPQAIPLMDANQVRALPHKYLIVAPTSGEDLSSRPMKLKKVRYFQESRFASLYDNVAPAAKL